LTHSQYSLATEKRERDSNCYWTIAKCRRKRRKRRKRDPNSRVEGEEEAEVAEEEEEDRGILPIIMVGIIGYGMEWIRVPLYRPFPCL
jgi:hypothetical protein